MINKNIVLTALFMFTVGISGYLIYSNQTNTPSLDNSSNTDTTMPKEESKVLPASTKSTEKPENSTEYQIQNITISYDVLKKFLSKDSEVITGKTNTSSVTGWISSDLQTGYVSSTIDFKDLATNSPKRDEDVLKMFSPAVIIASGVFTDLNLSSNGEEKTLSLPLEIQINGVTKTVVFEVKTKLEGDSLVANGTSSINMQDFNINPPSMLNIYTVDPKVNLKFELTANKVTN